MSSDSQTIERENETVFVVIDEIELPAGWREIDPQLVETLAVSIAAEGLHQPIKVRPNPDRGGKPFVLVFGRHRIEAHRTLGRRQIRAQVCDMDAKDAEMATISENLFRNPLKKEEYFDHVAKWHAWYTAKFPEAGSQGKGVIAAAERRKREAAAQGESRVRRTQGSEAPVTEDSRPESAAEGVPAEDAAPPKSFPRVLADATGQSVRKAQRDVKKATRFAKDEVSILEKKKVSNHLQDKIAAIADPIRRSECITFIASGMDPEQAIREAKAGRPAPDGATVTEVRPEGGTPSGELADMSDEEWLAKYCPIRSRLASTKAFDKDALLYRQLRDARTAFANKTRKILKQSKTQTVGIYFMIVARFLNCKHPQDWLVCGQCKGTGTIEDQGECTSCRGGGYKIG
ncbi:MAG: ParB N-terminal domain-containing protein [Isosphaeraceae bacterium]|nr:ParB N-terminal domain-containing protein [Isosphaeraceae bacterium]